MDCFYCKGSLSDSITNHVVSLPNCIIIVKNVPCTECAQCGAAYYDDVVAERLESIVNSLKGSLTELTVVNYADKVA